MSFLGNLFGGGAKQTSIATTSSEPPEYAKPYLESGLKRAEELFNAPRSYYPNQSYIDFSPQTLEAMARGETRAMAGSPLLSNAQNFVNTSMSGGFVNPAAAMYMPTARGDFLSANNPYLQAALQPAVDQIQGQFSRSGRLGSGANISAMTGALAPIYAQNYANERINQTNAMAALGNLAQTDYQNRYKAAMSAPGLAEQDYSDIAKLAGFGLAREQKSAEQLADDINRFNFLQAEPSERLQEYMALVRGGTMGGQRSQPVYSDPTASAIGNLATLGQAAYYGSKAFGG